MATLLIRRCLNEPNVFYYICGDYTLEHNRKTINNFVNRAYLVYFKVTLGDQGKPWAPHIVCKPFVEYLRQWTSKSRKSIDVCYSNGVARAKRSLQRLLFLCSKN